MFENAPPPENGAAYEVTWKRLERRRNTDYNKAHAFCVLNNQGYKHTLTICNTYCFFSATMVTRTRLNVTLQHAACLVIHVLDTESAYCAVRIGPLNNTHYVFRYRTK